MSTAYAHESSYPHIHPHTAVSTGVDTLISALFLALLVVLALLSFRWLHQTRQTRHELRRDRKF